MRILGMIVGGILLLPIAIVIVTLLVITLVGGYIAVIIHFLWDVVIFVVLAIILYKVVKYFVDRKGS